jgi:hypothetical protein
VYPSHVTRLSFITAAVLGEGKRYETCVEETFYIGLNVILKQYQHIIAFGVKDQVLYS